jgi:ABC-type antimicrobial peptide transport system permease subunit
MRRILRDTYANERTLALLVGVFAALALVVTVISLYGLVSHAVARQRREIGIRLALGARPRQIVVNAMGEGMLWVGLGVAVGLLLAGGVARLAGSMLYGVAPLDPAVFVLTAGGFISLTAVASYIPARRAAGTNPAITLREE